MTQTLDNLLTVLETAQSICGAYTAEECPDSVVIPINTAVANVRKIQGKCYYSADGTLMNANGTRSIFDDVDE